jgi:dTDP-glucose 4,6-dehydratase
MEHAIHPRRVLVTGGTGFFGLALLRQWWQARQAGLIHADWVVWSRHPKRFLQQHPQWAQVPGLTFEQVDVQLPHTYPAAADFSHVFHLATDSTQGALATPLSRFDAIYGGTRHVLEYAHRCGAKRFLLASSGAVYGPQPADLSHMSETYPGACDPADVRQAYGCAKRAAEGLAFAFGQARALEVVVARCFAFSGEDLPVDVHFAVGNFVRDAVCSSAIVIRGNGTAVRSYLDQQDLADWLWWLVTLGQAGQAYNVGSDQPVSMIELAQRVSQLQGQRKPVRILGADLGGLRSRYVPCVDKILKESGLKPRFDLDASLSKMLRVVAAHAGVGMVDCAQS